MEPPRHRSLALRPALRHGPLRSFGYPGTGATSPQLRKWRRSLSTWTSSGWNRPCSFPPAPATSRSCASPTSASPLVAPPTTFARMQRLSRPHSRVGALSMQRPVKRRRSAAGRQGPGLLELRAPLHGSAVGLGGPIQDPALRGGTAAGRAARVHGNRSSSAEVGGGRVPHLQEMHCYAFPAGLPLHFTSIILKGVPVRFPKLRLAFLEVGAT